MQLLAQQEHWQLQLAAGEVVWELMEVEKVVGELVELEEVVLELVEAQVCSL